MILIPSQSRAGNERTICTKVYKFMNWEELNFAENFVLHETQAKAIL